MSEILEYDSDLGIEIIEGVPHFATAEDFTIVFEFLSDKSDDEIEEWEKSIGFKSFRRVFDQSAAEFHNLNSREGFEEWQNKYEDILYIEDNTVEPIISNFKYQFITNRRGEFVVNGIYNKILQDKIITVLDGDRAKLSDVDLYNLSDSDDGIIITPTNHVQKTEVRSNQNPECYSNKANTTVTRSDNKRKAFFEIWIDYKVPQYLLEQNVGGLYQTEVWVRVHGHKKNFLGIWNKYKTRLAFDNIQYRAIDGFGGVHNKTIGAHQSNGKKRDLYYYESLGPTSFNFLPDMNPQIVWVLGRGVTNGVGANNWAVICCGDVYPNSCPSSAGSLPW